MKFGIENKAQPNNTLQPSLKNAASICHSLVLFSRLVRRGVFPVNVILHAREGEISELEVISIDATEVFSMPKQEMLEVV